MRAKKVSKEARGRESESSQKALLREPSQKKNALCSPLPIVCDFRPKPVR